MSELIWDFKSSDESGGIIEQKIWAVSKTRKNPFGYKFSLCYIKDGKRILCYDNGENKPPHKHYRDKEYPYNFKDMWTLLTDFSIDLEKAKRGEI